MQAKRSRWSFGNNLGAMVISDEMMSGLKYCIQWLQYASARIDRQIALLSGYLHSFMVGNRSNSQSTPPLSPHPNGQDLARAQGMQLLSMIEQVKREIVDVLRRVVEVVGKYAALYLPESSRRTVRGFIMALPSRWVCISLSKFVTYVSGIHQYSYQL
jgi:hypothetical protein